MTNLLIRLSMAWLKVTIIAIDEMMKAKMTFIAISIKFDSIHVSCAMMAKESHCQKV